MCVGPGTARLHSHSHTRMHERASRIAGGYPSVMTPTENESDGFGKGTANCVTLSACQQMLQPLGWGATVVAADIKQGKA